LVVEVELFDVFVLKGDLDAGIKIRGESCEAKRRKE
jgi:hypothetical protein